MRRNKNKADSIETGGIVIAQSLLWSDRENYFVHHAFSITDNKPLSTLLNI